MFEPPSSSIFPGQTPNRQPLTGFIVVAAMTRRSVGDTRAKLLPRVPLTPREGHALIFSYGNRTMAAA
jgi:hypothetical protein